MSRSFRFVPPEARPDLLTRPRLLRTLTGRWQHRVTSLVGGPGLGKTTLLAQAIAENKLAPRGVDAWVGIERQDADADRLARVVAAALSGGRLDEALPAPDPASVADAMWQRSPTDTCLIFDDAHRLLPGSSGAAWLADLLHQLPANGHIVVASPHGAAGAPRTLPGLGHGAVRRRGRPPLRRRRAGRVRCCPRPVRFGGTGGWPAMAALTASTEREFTGSYLWEEVLEPLGWERRHLLAVLCDLGGADDELASAVVDCPVDLLGALAGVPLVARDADGWYVPHALWRTAPRIGLDPGEATEIRRRAIRNLTARGRYEAAFGLVESAGLWDEAPAVLRTACLAGERPSRQLGRWLAASPEPVRAAPAASSPPASSPRRPPPSRPWPR